MRKNIPVAVLAAFSTMLGFVPLAVNAQIAPNQVIICSGKGVQGRVTFKLNGKSEGLDLGKCRTFSGASTFLFYTEYGRNPRFIIERQLSGGGQYQLEYNNQRYEVVPVEFKRT